MKQQLIGLAVLLTFGCGGVDTVDLLDGKFIEVRGIDTSAPSPISPSDNAIILEETITLFWANKEDATSYTVEIATDTDFQDIILTDDTPSEPELEVTLPDDITYYWRVTADTTGSDAVVPYSAIHRLNDTIYVHCPDTETECTDSVTDTNRIGNQSFPFHNIQNGVNQASALDMNVFVARRNDSNEPYSGSINLLAGVRLFGAYTAETWVRTEEQTAIASDALQIVLIGSISNETTVLDGFDITATSDDVNYVVFVQGADSSLTISNNSFTGPDTSEYRSIMDIQLSDPIIQSNSFLQRSPGYVIALMQSMPSIRGNTISVEGVPNDSVYGISTFSSSPLIEGNNIEIINDGIGPAIDVDEESNPVIVNNRLATSDDSTFATVRTVGGQVFLGGNIILKKHSSAGTASTVELEYYTNSEPPVFNNTMYVHANLGNVKVINLESLADPYLLNNIISFSGSAGGAKICIAESAANSDPLQLLNNNVFGCPNLYRDENSNNRTVIGDLNDDSLTTNNGVGSASGNINFDDSSSTLFVNGNGADDDISTFTDNDYNLKTTATGVIEGSVTCPTDYTVMTQSRGGHGSNDEECKANIPWADSVYGTEGCENTFLIPAIEIFDDEIGNDNGLCEENEECIINPNMGAYGGHGDLVDAGCDVSGIISGVTLKKYSENGY